jgi:hypothetical protein
MAKEFFQSRIASDPMTEPTEARRLAEEAIRIQTNDDRSFALVADSPIKGAVAIPLTRYWTIETAERARLVVVDLIERSILAGMQWAYQDAAQYLESGARPIPNADDAELVLQWCAAVFRERAKEQP